MVSVHFSYVNRQTPVQRLDARAKIIALLVFSIAILLVRSWWGMAACTMAVLVIGAIARIPLDSANRMLAPVYVLAAFSFAFHVIGAPMLDGIATGAFFALRMIVLVAASFIVCLTTTASELLEAFTALIRPLRAVRFPVDDAAFTLALSVRFIPVIEEEFRRIRIAQIARGADAAKSPLLRARNLAGAFAALFIGLFRHADSLAQAMDTRCYGAAPERTRLR